MINRLLRSACAVAALLLLCVGELSAQEGAERSWQGSYPIEAHLDGTWKEIGKLVVHKAGKISMVDKTLVGAKFSGDTLSWSSEAGNASSGQLTFKSSDESPFYWDKKVSVCATGWIQSKGAKKLNARGLRSYFRWQGSYPLKVQRGDAWLKVFTITVASDGTVSSPDKAPRNFTFTGDVLDFQDKEGNAFGQLSFKENDDSPEFWVDLGRVGRSCTGWLLGIDGKTKHSIRGLEASAPKLAAPVLRGGVYGHRWGKKSFWREGGSKGSLAAVESALVWLAKHQSDDGRWDCDGWQACCKKARCKGPGHDNGDGRYDVGVTSLSLLAFMGHGQSHRFGIHKKVVHKGLRWLVKQQKADGSMGFSEGEEIYNHALATAALCEAYALTADFRFKKYARKALDFCIKAQNPGQGWKYGIKPGNNDTSVTGAMYLAVKSAQKAGLKVPARCEGGALDWFKRVTGPRGSVGYQRAGGGSAYIPAQKGKFDEVPVNTAIAIYSRIKGGGIADPGVKSGAKLLMADLPTRKGAALTKKTNFYYWYYGTNAMFQLGGAKWKTWNKSLQKATLPYQRKGGCADGSWDGVGEWCIAGGRVYATAINALTLETYYRYKRVGEKK